MNTEALKLLKERRSCRSYKPEQITDAELDAQLAQKAEQAKKTLAEVKERTDLRALRRNEAIRRAMDYVVEHSTIEEG